MEQLERAFNAAMVSTDSDAVKKGYRPTYFMRMVEEHGGVKAAIVIAKPSQS